MNERNSSRIARSVRGRFIGEFPRKSYSLHGVSPHVAWSPRDQCHVSHVGHWRRRKPRGRDSSTSESGGGMDGPRRGGPFIKIAGRAGSGVTRTALVQAKLLGCHVGVDVLHQTATFK